MSDSTSKYRCTRCGKDFEQKSHYDNHRNRKKPCIEFTQNNSISPKIHSILPQKSSQTLKSEFVCNYCRKEFSRKDNLHRHIDGYCKVKRNNDEKMEDLMSKMVKMENELKNMSILKKDIELLKSENAKYKQIVNHQTINIKNQQINNYISVCAYGKENLSKLTNIDYKKILYRGFNSVHALVEKLHFDKNNPENHNVYISNMRDDYILVFDGLEWLLRNRDDVLQQICDDKIDILEEKFEEFVDKLDQLQIKKFERFLKQKDDDIVVKRIKKDLKELLYNKRNIIKNTRKQMKEIAN
jgi:hypothetical protein